MDRATQEFLREAARTWKQICDGAEHLRREAMNAGGSRPSQGPSPAEQTTPKPPPDDAPQFPPVRLSEDAEAYFLEAAVPGADPGQFDVSISSEGVTISGGTRPDPVTRLRNHRDELPTGPFLRTVPLPGEVAAEQVSADYEHGILTVRMPKANVGRRIQVQVKA